MSGTASWSLFMLSLACWAGMAIYSSAAAQQFNRELRAEGPSETTTVNPETERAYLRVTSTVQGLRFESNRQIRVTPLGSGDWEIWWPAGTGILKIGADGFRLLELPPFNFVPRKSYELKITAGSPLTDLIPITVVTTPAEARVFIDGVEQKPGTVPRTTAGQHEIRVEKSGYRTSTRRVDVSASNVYFQFSLDPIDPVATTISSRPPGAGISIDGLAKGETDRGLFLLPGTYSLRLRLSGYLDVDTTFQVSEQGENRFAFTLTKSTTELGLSVTPAGARVLVNREDFTGRTSMELSPGRYRIDCSSPGYRDTTIIVDVVRGEPLRREIQLRAITGALQVTVQPLDAEVVLRRGQTVVERWRGLKRIGALMVGEYDLTVQAPGYADQTRKVVIAEARSTTEEFALRAVQPEAPTGLGVGSAGRQGCSVGSVSYMGKTYNTVRIGSKCWLKENLDVGMLVQGSVNQQDNSVIEKYCYGDDPANCARYGGLYQWNEAMQYSTVEGSRGICPPGWHIPTRTELEALKTAVGGDGNALKAVDQGKGSGAGTNTSGFSALLAGYRYSDGYFSNLSYSAYIWSSTQGYAAYANYLYLDGASADVSLSSYYKTDGFSVRCLED